MTSKVDLLAQRIVGKNNETGETVEKTLAEVIKYAHDNRGKKVAEGAIKIDGFVFWFSDSLDTWFVPTNVSNDGDVMYRIYHAIDRDMVEYLAAPGDKPQFAIRVTNLNNIDSEATMSTEEAIERALREERR